MSDKVTAAREAIADVEARAASIKEDIQILMDTDERMKHDEAYRNRILNEKLREVQKLQEESQMHQRIILQNQQSSTATAAPSSTGRVTRSKAAAAGGAGVSTVAANIQQASRTAMQASRSTRRTDSSASRPRASDDEQRRSVQALYDARHWLINRETELLRLLEGCVSHDPPRDQCDEYLLIQSVRLYAEKLCTSPVSPESTEALRKIIQFVASRSS